MAYACPVLDCDYVADDVDQLAGHIGGMADTDELHADYGNVRRFELFEYEVTRGESR